MKAVAISLILLVAVISLTVANSVFVNDRINSIKDTALSILDDGVDKSETARSLILRWERDQKIFRLSTSLREIDRATEALLTLAIACENANEWAIRQSCVLFCDALDDIARYETFNIINAL